MQKKTKVCMIVQNKMVKGGIAAVVSGYYGSKLEQDYDMIYVESYKDGGKLTKLFKGICGYIHFAKVLLVDRPDIVHMHSSFGASFYRSLPFIYMASWAKKPIINHIHGADFDEFYVNASDKKKAQIKKVYNKCSILIALSAEWADRFMQIVPAKKVRIIVNYSTLHEEALEERLQRTSNNTVLFLGEIGRRKGCYDIPAVAAEVVRVVPNVKFILAGVGSEADEKAVKELFKDKGVAEYVVFPGWVRGADKDKLLRESDVFYLPSYNEGMPMSILDAMGYGLPIVSTNVGGIPKIVHDEENGNCCEVGDIKTMSDSIAKLLTDRDELTKFGKKSFEIVKNGYSLERHLELVEEVYESLLGAK